MAEVTENFVLPSVWEQLETPAGRALIDSLRPWDEATSLQRLARVRADPAWFQRLEVVAAAATQAQLRDRARSRFGDAPAWWTRAGLEQATRPELAAAHARRYLRAGVEEVADLCCGVGRDALALAAAGVSVSAIDRDPDPLAALSLTRAELGLSHLIRVVQADVVEWVEQARPGLALFCDPARRGESGRHRHPESWSPRWSWVLSQLERHPNLGAKLAPGIPHELLPAQAQSEWTSMNGSLLEAALWFGQLRAAHPRSAATRLATVVSTRPGSVTGAVIQTIDNAAGIPQLPVSRWQEWLAEPDPAVIRSGLVGVLGAQVGSSLLDPHIAYLTGSGAPPQTPFASTYLIREELPFAVKTLGAHLRRAGFGNVVIKKRGVDVDPILLRRRLRLSGDGPPATVVLTRVARGPLALLVEPVAHPVQSTFEQASPR